MKHSGNNVGLFNRIKEMQKTIDDLQKHNHKLSRKQATTESLIELIHGANVKFNPPQWTSKKVAHHNTGVPTFFASDWHWDEVVEASQINYVNAYNREIAHERAKKFFSTGVELLTQHMTKPRYDYCVLALGGDMLSGNIHEELRESNEFPILQSVLDVTEKLIAGITLLHDTFGRVYVPCVVGNHGRLDRKPRFKNKAFDNYDWLVYQLIARHFGMGKNKNPDINIDVTDGTEVRYDIYNTRYLLLHGDDFQGGSGIAGPYTPWMLGDAKLRKRQMAVRDPYDVVIMGHWHSYTPLKNIIVNGSLKGFDEYSRSRKYDFEPPTQAVWVTHPEIGITVHWPVYLEPKGRVFR